MEFPDFFMSGTIKSFSEMTYNVSSGTLNSTIPCEFYCVRAQNDRVVVRRAGERRNRRAPSQDLPIRLRRRIQLPRHHVETGQHRTDAFAQRRPTTCYRVHNTAARYRFRRSRMSRIEERFLPQNYHCGKNPESSQTPVATAAAAGARGGGCCNRCL